MLEPSEIDSSHVSRADSAIVVVQFLDEERVESVEDWVIQVSGLQSTEGLAAQVINLARQPGAMPRYSLAVTERRTEWGAAGESIEFLLRTAGDRATDAVLALAFAELAHWLRRRVVPEPPVLESDSAERHARWAVCVNNAAVRVDDLEVLGLDSEPGGAVVVLQHAPTRTRYTVRLSTVGDGVHQSTIKWERTER